MKGIRHIQHINEELAVVWEDGSESYLTLKYLRRACPCAGCSGERDLVGNVYKAPASADSPSKFRLKEYRFVGGYALLLVWADGHDTGLYSYDYLGRLAESAAAEPEKETP